MSTRVRPALTPEQWSKRSTGGLALRVVDDEVHLVVRGSYDEVASVTGPDHLWRLIALANDALPSSDARKITPSDVAVLRRIASSIQDNSESEVPLALAQTVCDKIAALLPSR